MAQKVSTSPALLSITPPPPNVSAIITFLRTFLQALFDVLRKHALRLNAAAVADGSEMFAVMPYTVATLPVTATLWSIVGVSDEAGGSTLAFWDGTNWRRFADRAVVS